MNPQPSKPTITNPMTAIAQSGGDHLGVRPACEPVACSRRLWLPNKIDAPSERVDTGFLAAHVARFARREVRSGSDACLRFVLSCRFERGSPRRRKSGGRRLGTGEEGSKIV
jgi:hypothetical protein